LVKFALGNPDRPIKNHSKVKEDVKIIRKGMLNVLEQTLHKQAIGIVKEEKEIEKLEAQLKENTTKKMI